MKLRRAVAAAALAFMCVPAHAQTPPSDFDFMVGRWTGRQNCKSGIFDVVFEAAKCVSDKGRYCEHAYTGSGTARSRTPGVQGGGGSGAGEPTSLPTDINFHVYLPFGTLEGGAHYSKASHMGRFATTGVSVSGVVMALPYGMHGSFTVSRQDRRLSYIADFNLPEGADHCSGILAKQAPPSGRKP